MSSEKITFFPNQTKALEFIRRLSNRGESGLLEMATGGGKTLIALTIAEECRLEGKQMLYVCKKTLVDELCDQADKFYPDIEYVLYHPDNLTTKTIEGLRNDDTGNDLGNTLVIIPYSYLSAIYGKVELEDNNNQKPKTPLTDISEGFNLLFSITWDFIFFDESQTLRNHKTKAFRAAISLCSLSTWCMTGTMCVNRGEDLWTQLKLVGMEPGSLPMKTPIEEYRERFSTCSLRLTSDKVDFVERDDGKLVKSKYGIPDLIKEEILLEMYTETKDCYHRCFEIFKTLFTRNGTLNYDGKERYLKLLGVFKQLCIHPWVVEPHFKEYSLKCDISCDVFNSAKLAKAIEIVEKKKESTFLIFCQYKAPLYMLEMYFKTQQITASCFTGDLKASDREKLIGDFKDGKTRVMLLTYGIGSTGHNFFAADSVITLVSPWNEVTTSQSVDRVWRSGQKSEVTWYNLKYKKSMDGMLDFYCDEKSKVIKKFKNGKKSSRPKAVLDNVGICVDGHKSGTVYEVDKVRRENYRFQTPDTIKDTENYINKMLYGEKKVKKVGKVSMKKKKISAKKISPKKKMKKIKKIEKVSETLSLEIGGVPKIVKVLTTEEILALMK